ncbi:MAG TPA: hypothetical protein DCQ83_03315 [Fibrobacteres bacterium]|nr:hypothetical protein [Fibrobacterota bacterium]
MDFLAVALGGAVGSVTRYGVQTVFRAWLGAAFPWGTLVVNLLGSFLIGLCAALVERGWPGLRPWMMTGCLGGFATFSAFSLENIQLLRNGQPLAFGGNILLSITGGVLLAYAGYMVARAP